VTFNITTQDGTTTVADSDYVTRSLTGQTIATGQQTYTFDVTVNGDVNVEPNETAPAGGVSFDIATHDGSATTANNDYAARSLTNQTIAAGQSSYTFDVTVNGDTLVEPDETFLVNVTNVSNATLGDGQAVGTIQNDDTANLKISQVYGGGGNSAATYQNDFIEIFNRGTTTVDFSATPYSVQYAGATSSFGGSNTKTDITSGTIAPGRYFLVQQASAAAIGAALPTPDASGNIALAATAGKVALVAGTTPVSATTCPGDDLGTAPLNPTDNNIVDFVGYGSTASCYEGPTGAAAPSNATADFRKAGGCIDTDQNAADFLVSAPFPRNSTSPSNNCAGGAALNLTISDVTVAEGNSGTTTVTFTVSLSAPAQGADVTFDITTQNNTALSGSDYVAKTLTNQVIPAGQITYTFDVTVNGDTAIESDETFFVNVTNVTGANATNSQGVGTIQHDDLPTLSIDDVSAAEGDSGTKTFTFHVTLSAAAPATVTFDIATADGTAQDGNQGGEDTDYQARSIIAQTIAQGSSSFNFEVTVNGDLNVEPNEAFLVNVTNVAGATVLDGQGQGTIQNDDSPVLSIDDVSASEGNSGTTTFTFHVTLSIPAGPGGVTFDIATTDGTARDHNPVSEDNDYVANSLTNQTIPAGQSSYNFDVTVNGDTTVEPDESFSVNVANVSGASVLDGAVTATIQNDDSANLVISQVYPGGGLTSASFTNDFIEVFNRGTTTVDFSVTPYSVQFLSTGAATWAKTDLISGTLSPGRYFLVKETSGGAAGSALPTPDATGSINLTSTTAGKVALVAGATLLTGNCPGDDGTPLFNPVSGTVVDFVGYGSTAAAANHCYEGAGPASFTLGNNTIADSRKSGGCVDTNENAADFITSTPNPRNTGSAANDCSTGFRPDISINDPAAVTEGDSGTTTLTFNVTLSAPNNTQTVTMNYATADGTATAGADYQSDSGTVTFNPTETNKSVVITIDSDLLDEVNETFLVNLSIATNAVILDSQGRGTITDNDPTPSLSINALPSIAEGDTGTSTASFTVTLSAASGQTVTVNYATADGSATIADNDYVATNGMLTFNPGETTKSVAVTINGDFTFEPNEAFFVNLASPSATATISDPQGQGTIVNDDAAPPTPNITIDDPTLAEGDTGTKTIDFTVSLSISSAQTVTADYSTASAAPASGIATAGTDYMAANGTVTFNPGETSKPITITINGDKLVEPNETFFINLTNASPGSTITDPQGVGTITNDDTPLLVISQIYPGGGLTTASFTNDFIELFNRGTTTIDFAVTPYSVQFLSTAATTWVKTDLATGTIGPGQYFLIQEASGGAVGGALPTPDATGSINLTSTTAGKVALVSNTTFFTGNCPGDDGVSPFNPANSVILDFVGYGGNANTANHCYEGTGPAPFSTSTDQNRRSTIRTSSCTDTNVNSADFTNPTNPTGATPPVPRNKATPAVSCP
jgi:fibronectin-binding autotransporter adhesin